ncbi:MAG TPA: ABC transporter substrate-binding protein [Usitatibacter sp.]|nr:ABC transporter substrate-binding protein [Usitatibacter sp.]
MKTTRRQALGMLSATLGMGVGLNGLPAFAQDKSKRMLTGHILGNSLAIHIPAIAALNEGLPALGYPPPKLTRIDSMQVMTQSIIGKSADLGEADISSTLQASIAGADLRVIGLVYANSSLVFVANSDVVKDFGDLRKPGVIVAVNSKGDWMHAMLTGPLLKRGVDPDKVTIVEIGGSASRVQALLANRVQAVPVHIDQTPEILAKGNYRILLKPWEEYKLYIAECWLVSGEWLKNPDNRRLAVDIQKATIASFRRTNRELGYFGNCYRKYSTIKGAANMSDEQLRPVWELLSKTARAWPDDGNFRREQFRELLPAYKSVGAFPKEPDLDRLIDLSITEQALKELG